MTEIRIFNCNDGEVLCFPLALLQGEIVGLREIRSSETKYQCLEATEDSGNEKQEIIDASVIKTTRHEKATVPIVSPNSSILVQNNDSSSSLTWPVLSGYFKILVPLKAGENRITIFHNEGCVSKNITIHYEPQHKKRYVRLVYIKCVDSDGTFDAPEGEDNSVESAVKRLQFNAQLLQTFTAESLHHHGLGRVTFKLEEDEDGIPKVHIFTSQLKTEESHQMTGMQLYDYFLEELQSSSLYDPECKWVVFMSCTHYDPPGVDEFKENSISKYVRAHTALGGGSLGVFGTGGLHTWAPDIASLVKRFTDTQVIDRHKLFDDSCGRRTYWANYSTGLGATMHELGHAFDLAHTSSGIMSRGFDDIHCVFTVSPFHKIDQTLPVSGTVSDKSDSEVKVPEKNPRMVTPWPADHPAALTCRGAHWYRSSAVLLRYHRWIDYRDTTLPASTPMVHWSPKFRGPVGNAGDSCQKNQSTFNDLPWLKEHCARIGGIVVYADKYVNSIQTLAVKLEENNTESQISRDAYGVAGKGQRYEFVFESPDEKLTRIDVRVGAWVDAIRFHSNKKSSEWFGGTGGDPHQLISPRDRWFTGFFGTYGDVLGSIGAHLNSPDETDISACSDGEIIAEASAGLRLIEIHDQTGEVFRHWEFLEPNPPQKYSLVRDEIISLKEQRTLLIEDDSGRIFRTGVSMNLIPILSLT